MSTLRLPPGVLGWRLNLLLCALVTAPLAATLQLRPGLADPVTVATISAFVGYVALTVSAALVYLHWRLTGQPSSAWLCVALLTLALPGLFLTGQWLSLPRSERGEQGWLLIGQLLVMVAVAVVVRCVRSVELRSDPMVLGLGLGATLSVVRWVVPAWLPTLPSGTPLLVGLMALVLGLHVAIAWSLQSHLSALCWVRSRLALAMAALGVSQAMLYIGDTPALAAGQVLADTGAAVLISGTALALLFSTIEAHDGAVADLETHLRRVEAGAQVERATLHEIRATMGGIASASRLVQRPDLEDDRRWALQQMIDDELGRLERLMEDRRAETERRPDAGAPVPLDQVLRPVVLRQQARGQDVLWRPTGHVVRGRGDDLAEVVGTLLENARVHAPGSLTRVEVRSEVEGHVDVVVTDNGPGAAPAMRATMFEWGARGPESRGQGIGLPAARKLVEDLGGDLVYLDGVPRGAVFLARIPVAAMDEVADVVAS